MHLPYQNSYLDQNPLCSFSQAYLTSFVPPSLHSFTPAPCCHKPLKNMNPNSTYVATSQLPPRNLPGLLNGPYPQFFKGRCVYASYFYLHPQTGKAARLSPASRTLRVKRQFQRLINLTCETFAIRAIPMLHSCDNTSQLFRFRTIIKNRWRGSGELNQLCTPSRCGISRLGRQRRGCC